MDDHNLSIESMDLLDRAKEIQGPDASDKARVRSKLMASLALSAAAGATAASAEAGATIAQSSAAAAGTQGAGAGAGAASAATSTASAGTIAGASSAAAGATTALAGTAAKIGLTKLIVGAAVVIGGAGGTGYLVSSRSEPAAVETKAPLAAPKSQNIQNKTTPSQHTPVDSPFGQPNDIEGAESKAEVPSHRATPVPQNATREAEVAPSPKQTRRQKRLDSVVKTNQHASSSKDEATQVQDTTPVSQATRLSNERALIAEAMTALQQGSPKKALMSLKKHEERFPQGALRQEREALRTSSRCQLSPEKGNELAEAYLERWPNSLLGPKVKKNCTKP